MKKSEREREEAAERWMNSDVGIVLHPNLGFDSFWHAACGCVLMMKADESNQRFTDWKSLLEASRVYETFVSEPGEVSEVGLVAAFMYAELDVVPR